MAAQDRRKLEEYCDFLEKKLNLPIIPKDDQDPLRSSLKLDTTPDDSESEMWAKESYNK